MLSVIVAILVCLIVYIYRSLKPPPPRICGVPHGPPVTSPRIKLSDGRYLAYRESGVDKANAKHKIIIVHGFNISKDIEFLIPKDLIEELGIYFLFYDRAGYGESDPYVQLKAKNTTFKNSPINSRSDQSSTFLGYHLVITRSTVASNTFPTD